MIAQPVPPAVKKRGGVQVLKLNQQFFRHKVGLDILGKPSLRAWSVCGERLARLRTSVQWAMGDWALYGEGRGDWGETYAQAVNILQYSEQTILNYVWVCNRFEISRRREKLSFTHHSVIAAIAENAIQDKLLDLAIAGHWGSRYLAEVAKPYKPGYEGDEQDGDGNDDDGTPSAAPLVYDGPLDDAGRWLDNTLAMITYTARVHIEMFLTKQPTPVALPPVKYHDERDLR